MSEIIKKVADEVFNRLRNLFRIRKLTPTECFRLMGMTDEDIARARAVGVSDSQLYKIAGNGLITNCVQFIAEHLYKSTINSEFITTDEKMVMNGYGVD